ncbi:MAG: hypothetical protein H7Y32_05490, partial [Chloroflexales bacterium]|nr:hypothetical protein [Chloroflexales bacterium]
MVRRYPLSLIAALFVVATLLAGCGAQGATTAPTSAPAAVVTEPAAA